MSPKILPDETPPNTPLLRSILFVPASNARALEKAKGLHADALIFDLEDAVGPNEKAAALGQLTAALTAGGYQSPALAVRINPDNAADTITALEPLLAAQTLRAIVIPKVRKTSDLTAIAAQLPVGIHLWAMIETALSVVRLADISALAETLPLEALILGPNDLRAELRVAPQPERTELSLAMASIVLHARAYGLLVLDGVYNAFKDAEGFAAECEQGRKLGFDGKTLIHPSQIAPCEAAFAPSEAEIDWARRVVDAFAQPENAGAGVVPMDGEMIERLHLKRAEALLALA